MGNVMSNMFGGEGSWRKQCAIILWSGGSEGLIGQGVLAENFGLGGIMMGCIIGFTFAIQLDVSITLEESGTI